MPSKPLAKAIFEGKCPKCRTGNLFVYPLKDLGKFDKMNHSCPHCGVYFEPEPGFYTGAMYVGYGFTVAFIAVVSLVLFIIGNPSIWVYISTIIIGTLLLVPLNYRYSRILFLYMFGGIKFDASKS